MLKLSRNNLAFISLSVLYGALLLFLGFGAVNLAILVKVILFVWLIAAISAALTLSEVIKLSLACVVICLYVVFNHLRIAEALAVLCTFFCIVATKLQEHQFLTKRQVQQHVIISILVVISAIAPLINSQNFTYYGTTARGEYSSILDIAIIVAGFLAANNSRVKHAVITVILLAILYFWLPSRSLIFICVGLIIFGETSIRIKILLISLLLAFVTSFLLLNEYFLVKVINMLSGEEQRLIALECGFHIISEFELHHFLFGMDIGALEKATADCLPEARLVEADFVDVVLRMGLIIVPIYFLVILKAWRINSVFGIIFLYGVFFGHVFFNPLALIPMYFACSYTPRHHFEEIKAR